MHSCTCSRSKLGERPVQLHSLQDVVEHVHAHEHGSLQLRQRLDPGRPRYKIFPVDRLHRARARGQPAARRAFCRRVPRADPRWGLRH